MYDEKTAIAQPSLELRLDELYKELGKAYYEGAFEDPLPSFERKKISFRLRLVSIGVRHVRLVRKLFPANIFRWTISNDRR